MFVKRLGFVLEGEGWFIRNERDGTVVRFEGSALVMKRCSGSVRWPAWMAEMVTYVWLFAGAGRVRT